MRTIHQLKAEKLSVTHHLVLHFNKLFKRTMFITPFKIKIKLLLIKFLHDIYYNKFLCKFNHKLKRLLLKNVGKSSLHYLIDKNIFLL